MSTTYTPTIGLEVHAELKTVSKMFCGCANDPHDGEANTHVCPVCLAHPGTLPVPNEQAIEMVLMFGQAVGAEVAKYSEFDRKNYFYPDIPKAYQISQYAYPFLSGGSLRGVELTRVHLEEDTARSQHDKGEGSLVDFNRAGVPLMELVTEPVIHDAETAGNFARELQLLLRTLEISDANMERGEMRVEANISVSKEEGKFGTKVEVKNLNSFKSVEGAIVYEVARQIELLEKGGSVVQETRGWDENRSKTFSQRSKETAKDYRYFPDPDIPKIDTSKYRTFNTARLTEKMPILPDNKREQYKNLGLTSEQIEVLIAQNELDTFFVSVVALTTGNESPRLVANYLISDVSALLALGDHTLSNLQATHFAEMIQMLVDGDINSRVAKDLLPALFGSSASPREIAEKRGLLQVSDTASLEPLIADVVAANQAVADEYRAGKIAALQFLLGQCMKATKGAANPAVLRAMLEEALK
jgi:aspartyl-tRNA(Asn)/glutamyl-tRNA(Gln) amidotransferase subunit B